MARILLVEDDATALSIAAAALREAGHDVTPTGDGVEALDRFKANPGAFDVVVTDVQMPGLDGIGLAEHVLAIAPRLKVILMSGLAGELSRAESLKSRGVIVLSKPYTLEILKSAVA